MSTIGDIASGIDISSLSTLCGWLVEQLTWEWVLFAVGNIIVREHDDLVLWDTVLLQDLVGVASVGLMSVVIESIGTSNDDSPVVGGSSVDGSKCCSGGEFGKHFNLKLFIINI